jgi:hypothetical protein
MAVNVNNMTVEEFDLYLKKNRDKLFNFNKYRTEQRRNTGVIYTPTLKTAMQRRKSNNPSNQKC